MLVSPGGRLVTAREHERPKALAPMLVSPDGRLVIPEGQHESKAQLPMVVTLGQLIESGQGQDVGMALSRSDECSTH